MKKLEFMTPQEVYEYVETLEKWFVENRVLWAIDFLNGALRGKFSMASEQLGEIILALRKIHEHDETLHVLPLNLAVRLPYAIKRLQDYYTSRK